MAYMSTCPGSKIFKDPMPELVNCSNCHAELEIWSDELSVRCRKCGGVTYKSRMPSCIDWCQHAEGCIGPELYKKLKLS